MKDVGRTIMLHANNILKAYKRISLIPNEEIIIQYNLHNPGATTISGISHMNKQRCLLILIVLTFQISY